ncbi:MAG TPA: hypothetical protein VF229_08090 [Burkholderiaceae bacterium]
MRGALDPGRPPQGARRARGTGLGRVLAAAVLAAAASSALAAGESYVGRPIYSEPSTGLQLPPRCEVDPGWRVSTNNAELEVWLAVCDGTARAWLLKRQVIEALNARQARLRYQVLDERQLPGETAGETASVQCSGRRDETGYVVLGARWRGDGKELRLAGARGALRGDPSSQRLADADVGGIDCTRFPEREAMMKRLQQAR